jgi:sulfite reductase (NADPH) hemoprotein beta-component
MPFFLSPDDRSRDVTQPIEKLHPDEVNKYRSHYLRGAIQEGLDNLLTGAIADNDTKLLKFLGIYQQDNRDLRDERRRQMLELAFQFMIRLRLPGGQLTSQQWLDLDVLARRYGEGSLRVTNRQTFQFHHVVKQNLKALMQGIMATGLDTIAACGDDNRGVMCAVNPELSLLHAEIFHIAQNVSQRLRPQTAAYEELWLDKLPKTGSGDEEPFYGRTYLPRKFKIVFALPPTNDVDVYTPDLGFVAIVEADKLLGFTILIGGGMGRTDNDPATYPRLGDPAGFCAPDQAVGLAEIICSIQRDYGDRVDRKHARFKYTVDDRGLAWLKSEIEKRLGASLAAPRPFIFNRNTEDPGWRFGDDGLWHYLVFLEHGRILDLEGKPLLSGFREIAGIHKGGFRLTPNQNVIITGVAEQDKALIEKILKKSGLYADQSLSLLRRNSMACVAFPTCGLAMAESERYLPSLVTRLEPILVDCGLAEVPITIRVSGCSNGCARPYVAEIALVGRAPGKYNLYLGGGHYGQRLNKLYLENVGEKIIVEKLTAIFRHFSTAREPGESFGDFVIRGGYVAEVKAGRDFNA